MYKIVIPFDEQTVKCSYNGEPVQSNSEMYVDENIGQIYCKHVDGHTYRGLTMENDSEIIDDLYAWYKNNDLKYDDNVIVLTPVFDGVDSSTDGISITLNYNNNAYSFHVDEPMTVRYFINKIFPSDQYYTDDVIITHQKTFKSYKLDETIYDSGIYRVEGLIPYITFIVDGDILQFANNPSKTSMKYKSTELKQPPTLKVKEHYAFNTWTSPEGNWNGQSLYDPVTFTGTAYLKQWTVTFLDCGDTVTKTVTDGDMVTTPECKKSGHTFLGWKEGFTCSSSNIIVYLFVILFVICMIVLFVPQSYIRNIASSIYTKTSH